jgi:hypothetical protein
MLIATPYPLLPANQFWTAPKDAEVTHSGHLFAGFAEEGLYNATLALLRLEGRDTIETLGSHDAGWSLLEYRPPFGPKTYNLPPVWITTVGRHGFWPVDVIPLQGESNYVLHTAGRQISGLGGYHPPGFGLALLLIQSIVVAFLWLYWKADRRS